MLFVFERSFKSNCYIPMSNPTGDTLCETAIKTNDVEFKLAIVLLNIFTGINIFSRTMVNLNSCCFRIHKTYQCRHKNQLQCYNCKFYGHRDSVCWNF